jgi:methyl-accepting chemotaxis protein
MARFSDIPILWRVVLAPLILLAMTVGVLWWIDGNTAGSLTVLADGGQQSLRSIEKVYESSAARLQKVDELVTTIYRAHGNVMRHISLAGSGLSDAKLAEIRAEIKKSLARAGQLVADDAAADGVRGTQDQAAATELRTVLAAYEKAVTEIGDQAEFDRLMAIGMVATTEATFEALNRTFLAMQAAQWSAAQRDAEQISRQSSGSMQQVRGQADATRGNGWVVAIVTLSTGLAFSLLIGRGITRPLSAITKAMTALAGGKLSAPVPAISRKDEVGQMARALVVFKDHMMEERRLAAEQAAERKRAAEEKQTALTCMADTIEAETGTALEQMRHRTSAMTTTADEMAASAARAGDAAQNAADAASQVMSNAQAVAGAAEQLTASVREIGNQVNQSSAIVGRAVTAGTETRTTIETLNQEVEKIGAVAGMIAEIAARTNLLALNATIEAARAGVAGKGFAVVASEVKLLANQTARSTQEIARHIAQVRSATSASVEAVVRIEQTITAIDTIAGSIATAVEQQGSATAEIARNMVDTARAAAVMTTRTVDVSAEASDTGRRAAEVRDEATGLNKAMEEMRHFMVRVVRTSTA